MSENNNSQRNENKNETQYNEYKTETQNIEIDKMIIEELIKEVEKLNLENQQLKRDYLELERKYTKSQNKIQKYEENIRNRIWESDSTLKNSLIDINNYEQKKLLSSGAYGDVFIIEHKGTKEEFAAKISKTKLSLDDNYISNIREINILSQMKHPSIVKMKGFSFKNFENEDYITIVMELMKHGSLQNILEKEQKGQFDFDYNNTHRQIIITGITFGMKFLHSYNIFHRDLKPGNILLDPELHPKIADFGSSKFSDPKHAYTQTQRYGTLFYMSPESHIDNHYGLESDVYSFGIMLFEILTAKPAYDMTKPEINSSLKFMNKVSYQHYRPQFQVPIKEVFMDLIQQCWDFEPSNRPTFAEIYEKLSSDENYILGDVDRYVFSNFLHELEQWEANESNFVIRNEETDIKLLIENEILRQKEEFLIKQVNSQATSS